MGAEAIRFIPVAETLPTHAEWSVDADEEEERSPEKRIKHIFIPDVGGDPSLLPMRGDKIHQFIDRCKCMLRVGGQVGAVPFRGNRHIGGRV